MDSGASPVYEREGVEACWHLEDLDYLGKRTSLSRAVEECIHAGVDRRDLKPDSVSTTGTASLLGPSTRG